jgi:hypothetical protein
VLAVACTSGSTETTSCGQKANSFCIAAKDDEKKWNKACKKKYQKWWKNGKK